MPRSALVEIAVSVPRVRPPAHDVATIRALSLRDGGTLAVGTIRTVLRCAGHFTDRRSAILLHQIAGALVKKRLVALIRRPPLTRHTGRRHLQPLR
jgi:hypothetical protein